MRRALVLGLCWLAWPLFLVGQSPTEQSFHPQIPTAWNDAEVETYDDTRTPRAATEARVGLAGQEKRAATGAADWRPRRALMQIDFPPDASRTPTQIRKINHSLTDRWSLRAHVWPRKHRADFDGEIRENLPPEQAQHAVDLLTGCGPGSLTYDVLAEGGGIEPILSECR